jgi:hypothetical protein
MFVTVFAFLSLAAGSVFLGILGIMPVVEAITFGLSFIIIALYDVLCIYFIVIKPDRKYNS